MAVTVRLVLDPARCEGHGLCALLASERVDLDEWGYPVVDPHDIPSGRSARRARRAVRGCPRDALRLVGDGPD